MKKLIAILLVGAIALSACACNMEELTSKLEEKVGEVVENVTPTPSPEEQARLDEQAFIEKYNAYIDFSNAVYNRFSDSLNRYYKYFGEDEKVNTKDPSSPYSFSEYDMRSINEAMTFADSAPATAADAGVKEAAPIVLDMMNLLNEIYNYYDLKLYVDDDFEKAQPYHTQLLELDAKLNEAWPKFDEPMEEIIYQQEQDALLYYKEQGLMIQYYANESFLNVKQLLNYLYENEISYDKVHKINVEELQPYYDACNASLMGFLDLLNDPEAMALEESFTGSVRFSMFKSDMSDLKSCITELYDRAKNGKKVSSDMSDASPSTISSKYSSAISNYNNII